MTKARSVLAERVKVWVFLLEASVVAEALERSKSRSAFVFGVGMAEV